MSERKQEKEIITSAVVPKNLDELRGFWQANWNRTMRAKDRLDIFLETGDDPDSEEKFFQGRLLIHRDSPINGGVYLGGAVREAIVVDDTKFDQEVFLRVYREATEVLTQLIRNQQNLDSFFPRLLEIVNRALKLSVEKTEEIVIRYLTGEEQKISLGVFLHEGYGVCRHQSLLTAYIIEKAILEKRIFGRVSVDRNFIAGLGGHSWVRFTDPSGRVTVIDTTLKYIGDVHGCNVQNPWDYCRPEEIKK
ncbi:MAG: hypothetical protein UW63_C0032G0006 [Candidatus Uhrbacteria bacterium GW2011_GWF2_44_350]|uniref:Transglutaminase-like domain-containing protein n=2 Tax=Candidatus Uhriibacteriota TaxID=1752732 RepID=A0A0G1JFY5_9BACT|nr:MAG: hypothetical protein UW63_C0032G0006 [Candidatus Uhrbacteria bacterium GW2011_GWF2_44_350]HBR80709.1 hypothetical protein [Candidatus Uhrbacteria bacterium]HCU31671.1 hypothetical protein [Candidatus Uhrbacteria bacterium]